MKKSPKIDERKLNVSPLQEQSAISAIASTKLRDVDAYVLSQNISAPQQSKFIFAFEGIYIGLPADEIDKVIHNLEIALKDLSEVNLVDNNQS